MCNEIEECSKELVVISYKLGLTPCEKLWDDLTLNLPIEQRNLMSQVEMYVKLKDNVKKAEQAARTSSQIKSSFKRCKKLIFKLFTKILEKPYYKKLKSFEVFLGSVNASRALAGVCRSRENKG